MNEQMVYMKAQMENKLNTKKTVIFGLDFDKIENEALAK